MKKLALFKLLILTSLLSLISACATNPVTGRSEMNFVSEQQELSLGKKQYMPSRQQQGGDYVADPKVARYVSSVGKKVSQYADRKLPYEFVVLNNSVPNAWALPGGKIAVNRGLLVELQSEAELAAVLGHEVVHSAARHSAQQMERKILIGGLAAIAGIVGSAGDRNYGAAAAAATAVGGSLLNSQYGRDAEREADYYGIKYMVQAGYAPEEAVTLQKTFVRLSKDKSPNWLGGLFASHPPSQERVINNQKLVNELKVNNGFVGRDRYQTELAPLLKSKDAYESYDNGVKAIKKKDAQTALSLANKAIKKVPNEGLFYSLQGDAWYLKGNWDKAYAAYNKAVSLNDNFYRFYLERGAAQIKRGNTKEAKQDIKRSQQLLDTKIAKQLLSALEQQTP